MNTMTLSQNTIIFSLINITLEMSSYSHKVSPHSEEIIYYSFKEAGRSETVILSHLSPGGTIFLYKTRPHF